MSTDVEGLVRDGMHRLAAVTEAPTGLAGRARRRVRQRRLTAVSAIAGAAAAISAVALMGVTGAGAPVSATSREWTTAYVIGRVVQSGVLHVTGVPWAQGPVSWAAGTAMIHGRWTYVQADYRHHEWYPASAFLVVPNACTGGLDVAEFNSVNWPGYVRQTLSCGKFTVAGHAWVDGKETIKITGSMTEPHWWAGVPHAEGRGALHVDAAFYVDPSTYLPLRVVWSDWSHAVAGGLLRGSARQDFQVLPPTPRNVAKATVTIPPGFRKVPGIPFGGPMFQFVG